MFLAAALTEYDDEQEIIERPEYGELILEQYSWGNDGELGSKSTAIDYDYCTDEQLGLSDEASDDEPWVYPIYKSSLGEVTTWKKKFKCIKKEDMIIWGDFNSPKG